MPPKSPDLPWAAYARYSDRRQDRSVEQQIAEFRKYSADHSLSLPDAFIFSDEAKSGKSGVSREDLLRLMELLERRPRPAAGVLLWASSRLSRDMDDSDWYKATIRRAGYQIVYIGEPMLQSIGGLEGRLMEDVTEYVDAKYRENLARDVVRGMLDELGEGRPVNRAPRGYAIVTQDGQRRIVTDPALEDTIRTAWEMRAAGRQLHDIHDATHLYKTAQGYMNMFRNRTYLGIMVWRGREYVDFCPALCTPAQWAAVQVANDRHVHPRRASSIYLLSGRAYCECGQPLFGQTSPGANGKVYRYYRCRVELETTLCNNIRADLLEPHVIEKAKQEFTPEHLATAYRAWLKRRGSQTDHASRDTERLKIKLLTINKSIENLLSAIEGAGGTKTKPGANGAAPRSLVDQLATRETERDKVRNELLSQPPPMSAAEFDLEAYCAGIQAQLADEDLAARKRVLQAIVEKVTIDHSHENTGVTIVFRRLPE